MVFGTVHHGIIKYERKTGKFSAVKTASKEIYNESFKTDLPQKQPYQLE
ncbi:MAG: hypothetical protein II956_08830 [Bacteroidales bacterium]|nr:hypothetical protein [Bacteroidales bacterium]